MKIKRNKRSYKWFLCGLILIVVLTISYRVSKANYRISNSIELTTGKVISSPYDFNLISMYIDGVEQEKEIQIPTDGYRIDESNSYCYKESKSNKDNNARLYTDELGNHVFSGISKSSKCILYFNKVNENNCGTACQYILSNIDTINIRRKDYLPFTETVTGDNAPTEKIMYEAPDDDGTSYYFAGNPTDNWVLFGGYYWRIIRINGDGSIRMIYQQSDGYSAFSNISNRAEYVGYFYTLNQSSGYSTKSLIYDVINNFYNNISELDRSNVDLNAGFCNDRSIYAGSGIGSTGTDYDTVRRLQTKASSNVTPTFKCKNKEDLFTYSSSNKGNNALENPIGMITADEAAYAGMVFESNDITNTNNYLYLNNKEFWTMTPYCHNNNGNAHSIIVTVNGNIRYGKITTARYALPVINLRSDVTLSGDGTISNPYIII